MELLGLNAEFNIVCQLYPTNVQWNRKYYEAGDFEIEIPASQYDSAIEYIYSKDLDELGMVQKPNWKAGSSGKVVSLSGFFYEKILDDDILYPTYYGHGNINAVIQEMLDTYAGIDMEYDLDPDLTETVDFQSTGDYLGEKLYELLEMYEYSYSIQYDFEQNKFVFKTFKGLDVTQDNTDGNNFVTFATTWENMTNPDVLTDSSDYKNYAVVGGEGEAEERIYVISDHSNGGKKKKIYIDARNSRYDSEKQTMDQYKASLKQEGDEELLNHQIIQNIDFDPVVSGYDYRTDYDLGYKCDAIVEDLGLNIQGRIVAIYEVWKQSQHTLELELGNQITSKINKIGKRVL